MAVMLCAAGCDRGEPAAVPEAETCPAGNGGLSLPRGFCARIVADNLGFVRHIAVGPGNRLYATLRNQRLGLGGLLMLSDHDGDGRFESIERLNDEPGMGIALDAGHLYFGAETRILRYPFREGGGVAAPEVVVDGLPGGGRHSGKSLALDGQGGLYVNVGASGNACQEEEGVPGSPGIDPCPELAVQASVWRFPADARGLSFPEGGTRYAGGIRNAYAIDWSTRLNALYVVQHGRDGLHELWPDVYGPEESAVLPAEVMLEVAEGSMHGWPYCYYDPKQARHVLAPEYGGDGERQGRCAGLPQPAVAFPAHFGPHALRFYDGASFPDRYHGGAFVAFHGSYNRGPLEQVGYLVAFVPAGRDGLAPRWEIFADGFAGTHAVRRPEDAEYRPTGLAVAPDGSLFISDSVQGRIWRVWHMPAGNADPQRR
jgi:glucose/arabinose dehydrogenase